MSVHEKINDWTPSSQDFVAVRWIDRPPWAHDVQTKYPTGVDGMTSREILKSGQLVTQWEFSAATLKSWAWLLAKILQQLELAVKAMNVSLEQKLAEEVKEGTGYIAALCRLLYYYVHWEEDVVKTLLTETSLAYSFHFGDRLNMSGM